VSSWQTVFKTADLHRAEMVKDILLGNDMEAVVVNLKDSAYHLGLLEVRVKPAHVLLAIKLIDEEISFGNE
jgi:hypothetical protein